MCVNVSPAFPWDMMEKLTDRWFICHQTAVRKSHEAKPVLVRTVILKRVKFSPHVKEHADRLLHDIICIRTWLFWGSFDDAVSAVFISPAAELWCVTGGPAFHFVLPKLLSWAREEKLQLLAWTWKTFTYFFFSFALESDSARDCGWSSVDVLLGKMSVSVWAKAAETSHTSNSS